MIYSNFWGCPRSWRCLRCRRSTWQTKNCIGGQPSKLSLFKLLTWKRGTISKQPNYLLDNPIALHSEFIVAFRDWEQAVSHLHANDMPRMTVRIAHYATETHGRRYIEYTGFVSRPTTQGTAEQWADLGLGIHSTLEQPH